MTAATPPQFRWHKTMAHLGKIPEPCILDGGHFYILQQLHYDFVSFMDKGVPVESRTERWINVPVHES